VCGEQQSHERGHQQSQHSFDVLSKARVPNGLGKASVLHMCSGGWMLCMRLLQGGHGLLVH